MIKGCLEGFIFSIIIIALAVIFSGGTIDMEILFAVATVAIIAYGLFCLIVSIIKWIINKL